MKPIPKIFHAIWLGDKPMPESSKRNLERWNGLHPDWDFKLWGDGMTLPCFHNEKGWALASLISRFDSLAAKSDILRLAILREYGGVYIDGDMEPVKSIEPILGNTEARETMCFVGWEQNGERINNAVIGASPNHHAIRDALDNLPAHLFSGGGKVNLKDAAYATGPFYLTDIWKKDGRVTKFPREVFYPYDWHEPWRANDCVGPDTYAIHRWDASWIGETLPEACDGIPKIHVIVVGESGDVRNDLVRASILQQSRQFSCLDRISVDELQQPKEMADIIEQGRTYGCQRVVFIGSDHVLDRNFLATHGLLPADACGISPWRLYSSQKLFSWRDARKSNVFPYEVFKFHSWQANDGLRICNDFRDVGECFSLPIAACQKMIEEMGKSFEGSEWRESVWKHHAERMVNWSGARCVWTYKTASTKLCLHPVNENVGDRHIAQWDGKKIHLPA